jgi:hypothetical protein
MNLVAQGKALRSEIRSSLLIQAKEGVWGCPSK